MSQSLYYTAPSNEIFEEMKQACISIWNEKDDSYGYATEKKNRIKDLQNIDDNFMYMPAMFDAINMEKLRCRLSQATLKEFLARL